MSPLLLSDFGPLDIAVRFLGVSLRIEDEAMMKLGCKIASLCSTLDSHDADGGSICMSHGLEVRFLCRF